MERSEIAIRLQPIVVPIFILIEYHLIQRNRRVVSNI